MVEIPDDDGGTPDVEEVIPDIDIGHYTTKVRPVSCIYCSIVFCRSILCNKFAFIK